MKTRHSRKPLELRKIAVDRIRTLFKEARSVFRRDSKLSDRYVELARKIAMKAKVKIPRDLKRQFCKRCHSFIIPGLNCTVRLQKSRVICTCHLCNDVMRFSYLKEQKERRKKC